VLWKGHKTRAQRKVQEISEREVPRKERLKGSGRLEVGKREGMESRLNK